MKWCLQGVALHPSFRPFLLGAISVKSWLDYPPLTFGDDQHPKHSFVGSVVVTGVSCALCAFYTSLYFQNQLFFSPCCVLLFYSVCPHQMGNIHWSDGKITSQQSSERRAHQEPGATPSVGLAAAAETKTACPLSFHAWLCEHARGGALWAMYQSRNAGWPWCWKSIRSHRDITHCTHEPLTPC